MQETDSSNLDTHDTHPPVQLPIINEEENMDDIFMPLTKSEHGEKKDDFRGNSDSSFYDESYVQLLDSIDPNFAEIRDIELDRLLDRIDQIIK